MPKNRRLRATVIVEPDCSLQSMKDMAASGVVGVRLQYKNVRDIPDLSSPEYRNLLRNIAELGWHVQLHDDSFGCRLTCPRWKRPESKSSSIISVDRSKSMASTALAFKRLLRSIEGGRTWVKLSSPFRLESEPLVRQAAQALLAHAGPERLMWGSDWPFAAFESRFSYAMALES